MLHQILFIALYLWILPQVLVSPFAGVLLYHWLDDLPPDDVYLLTFLPGNLSFITGALTFIVWLFREKKTFPRPFLIIVLMAALLGWVNITWQFALVPSAGEFEWNRTIKV